jgi:hypothetical protein
MGAHALFLPWLRDRGVVVFFPWISGWSWSVYSTDQSCGSISRFAHPPRFLLGSTRPLDCQAVPLGFVGPGFMSAMICDIISVNIMSLNFLMQAVHRRQYLTDAAAVLEMDLEKKADHQKFIDFLPGHSQNLTRR